MLLNYLLAVLVAAIAIYAIGALWYSVLFVKAWRQLMGVSPEAPRMSRVGTLIGGFVATLVLAFSFALILLAGSAIGAVLYALIVAIGIVGMVQINGVLYEGRPWKLFFINFGYYIVAFVVEALILYYW